jgi:hypothetical protein
MNENFYLLGKKLLKTCSFEAAGVKKKIKSRAYEAHLLYYSGNSQDIQRSVPILSFKSNKLGLGGRFSALGLGLWQYQAHKWIVIAVCKCGS